MEVDQQTVEEFKAMADYVEESFERQRAVLNTLEIQEREEVSRRLRWRERELEEIREHIAQLVEDLFARDVLRSLQASILPLLNRGVTVASFFLSNSLDWTGAETFSKRPVQPSLL